MARKKEQLKPLFAVKFDFYASLDAFCQEGIMLLQAVEFVLKHGDLRAPVANALSERAKAFRAAMSVDDTDDSEDRP